MPAAPTVTRPWGPRRFRLTGLLLAVLLLLGVGGANPPAPPELTQIGTVPTGPDANYLLTTDLLFVSFNTPDRTARLLTAYRLPSGRQLWQVRQRDPVVTFNLLQHGDGVLLSSTLDRYEEGYRTIAFDESTGQLRWSLPYQVSVLPDGRTGIAIDIHQPEPTDPDRGPPSGWQIHPGAVGTAVPPGAQARAIDLATGRQLWSASALAYLGPVTSQPAPTAELLAVPRQGAIEVWDARSRAVRRRLPSPIGPHTRAHASVSENLLLIRVDGQATVRAYAVDTLRPLWTQSMRRYPVHPCAGLLCQWDGVETRVFDPDTGNFLWRGPHERILIRQAGHLLDLTDREAGPRTVDGRTGQPRLQLTGWEINRDQGGPNPVLLNRTDSLGTDIRTWLAVLEPAATSIRLLGAVPYWVAGCDSGPAGRFLCRTSPSEIRIWHYQPS